MKKFPLILSLILIFSLLAGCAGTPVIYYTECDCPEGAHTNVEAPAAPIETVPPLLLQRVRLRPVCASAPLCRRVFLPPQKLMARLTMI